MADRRDYFHGQLLTEGELDAGFAGLEQADWNLANDVGIEGVITGIAVSESSPAALTVEVSIGTAYSKAGKRIRVDQSTTVDVSVDEDSVSTAVVGGANERWITIFAEFARAASDPRIDDNGGAVDFIQAESFSLFVRAGAEAGAGLGVKPAVDSTALVLCDILLTNGKATILDADINVDRRESLTVFAASAISADDSGMTTLSGANVQAVLEDADVKATTTAAHIAGTASKHNASVIVVDDAGFARLAGTDGQAVIDDIDDDLYGLEQFLALQVPSMLLDGGAPSDGGGLDLEIAAVKWASNGNVFVNTGVESYEVDDDDTTWVYMSNAQDVQSSTIASAIPNYGVPIAKVTAVAGSITEIVDLRVERDNESYDFTVRVGSNNSCHFSTLSGAVAVLKEWRSIYSNARFPIELVGTISEAQADLPIVLDSDDWIVRGQPGHRLDYGGGAEALQVALFDIQGDDILIEGLRIRVSTSVEANAADHDRVVFYGSGADRVTIRDCRLDNFDVGVHGFILFDSATDCTDWLVERCWSDDCRDFGIYAESPNTGGQGVAIGLVVRDCYFEAEAGGQRHAPSVGIHLEEGADCRIEGCHVEGFADSQIEIGDVDTAIRCRVVNCRVISTGTDGIDLDTNATRCHVTGCDVTVPATYSGVHCAGDRNFIVGNWFAGTAGLGVNATGDYSIVSLNQSSGAGNVIGINNTTTGNADDA